MVLLKSTEAEGFCDYLLFYYLVLLLRLCLGQTYIFVGGDVGISVSELSYLKLARESPVLLRPVGMMGNRCFYMYYVKFKNKLLRS